MPTEGQYLEMKCLWKKFGTSALLSTDEIGMPKKKASTIKFTCIRHENSLDSMIFHGWRMSIRPVVTSKYQKRLDLQFASFDEGT